MVEKKRDTIKSLRSDIEGKIEENTIKLSSEFDEKIKNSINVSRSDTEGKIEKSTIKLSNELDEKIKNSIDVSRSEIEDKIKESTIKLSNELDEKIKLNSDDILSDLRAEYRKQTEDLLNTIKSTSLTKRIYVIGIGSAFVIIIILLSLFNYSKVKSTAKDTIKKIIENQTNEENKRYVTKDFGEKLINEKVEGAINALRHELDARLEEETEELLNTSKKEESLKDLTANSSEGPKGASTDKQVQVAPEKTLVNLLKYNNVLTHKKTEKYYAFEGRHKKKLNKSSNTNHPSAITYLSDTIRLNPEDQYAYLKRGDAYYNLKQYKEAIADYNKTIELDPENVIAYGRRGDAYGGLKQYKEALIDYDKAVALDPGYAPAYNNRGNILYTIRQYEKAINDYSKTIELDPENVIVYSNRGLAYSGLKQYEKAIEDYNNAIEFAPEDAYNYIYLSRINIFTGNYDSALAVITKALSLTIKNEKKALALYIECVVKKLLGMDPSLSEREFNEIIKNDFTIWWDFNKFDSWLKNTDIDNETETFIREKSNLLRMHLEE